MGLTFTYYRSGTGSFLDKDVTESRDVVACIMYDLYVFFNEIFIDIILIYYK